MTLNQPKGDLSVMEKGTDLFVSHDTSILISLATNNYCATMTFNQPKGDLSVMKKGIDLSVFP
jgi:hypothetical protein